MHPSRGVNAPLCIIRMWDAELVAAETKRNAARGVRTVALGELHEPTRFTQQSTLPLGLRSGAFATSYGVTACLHVGSTSRAPIAACGLPAAVRATLGFNNAMTSLADWLFSGSLPDFPNASWPYAKGRPAGSRTFSSAPTGVGATRRPVACEGADPGAAVDPVRTAVSSVVHATAGAHHWPRLARRTSASGPTTRIPTPRGPTPRPLSRSSAPGWTRTSRTKSCEVTPSRCWSSTGSDRWRGIVT